MADIKPHPASDQVIALLAPLKLVAGQGTAIHRTATVSEWWRRQWPTLLESLIGPWTRGGVAADSVWIEIERISRTCAQALHEEEQFQRLERPPVARRRHILQLLAADLLMQRAREEGCAPFESLTAARELWARGKTLPHERFARLKGPNLLRLERIWKAIQQVGSEAPEWFAAAGVGDVQMLLSVAPVPQSPMGAMRRAQQIRAASDREEAWVRIPISSFNGNRMHALQTGKMIGRATYPDGHHTIVVRMETARAISYVELVPQSLSRADALTLELASLPFVHTFRMDIDTPANLGLMEAPVPAAWATLEDALSFGPDHCSHMSAVWVGAHAGGIPVGQTQCCSTCGSLRLRWKWVHELDTDDPWRMAMEEHPDLQAAYVARLAGGGMMTGDLSIEQAMACRTLDDIMGLRTARAPRRVRARMRA